MSIESVRATTTGAPQPPAAAVPSPPAAQEEPKDSVQIAEPGRRQVSGPISREELVRMSSELASMGKDLKPGDRIVVRVDGQAVAEVSKEGPDRWNTFKSMVSDTAQGVVSAANTAIQEDPSFTFREAIEVARQRVEKTDLEGLKDVTLKGLVPAARGIALMLDVYRAKKTFENPESTFIDKFIDGGHVATDVAGLVGALPQVLPALKGVPGINGFLMAAVIGDIVAFGYHFLRWFQKTGNRPFGGEKKDQPAQPPAPPAVQIQIQGVPTSIAVPATAQSLRSFAH